MLVASPSHTKPAFDVSEMPGIVDWASKICKTHDADAIVACGHSGLVIAGALSYVTKIPVLAVRKKGEPVVANHNRVSGVLPEGKAKRWVWLDDFLASGGTFRNAMAALWNEMLVESPLPVAILEYYAGADDARRLPYKVTDDRKYACQSLERSKLAAAIPHYNGWAAIPADTVVPTYGYRQW